MKVTTKEVGKNKVELTIEVPETDFEVAVEKAYRTMVKKINVPGFRKGKAPRFIIENMYGWEIFLDDALQSAVPQAYLSALQEIEYTVVSEPEYEMVQLEKNKPLIFKAVVFVKPEIVLGDYKGLELEKPMVKIEPEEIDQEIENMRQRYAKLVVLNGESAEMGDFLTINFVGKINGEPFEGGQAENYSLELGSQTFIPGFEEQLVGTKTGETKDLDITFPQDYSVKELAGQKVVFTVDVLEIKRKELAPLDDEFAKDVSEFATLQELRDEIANKLEQVAKENAEKEFKDTAVQKVVDNAQVEIPEVMINGRLEAMVQNMEMGLRQQGIPWDKFLELSNQTQEDIEEKLRPEAEKALAKELVLEKIAQVENIVVSAEEYEAKIRTEAAKAGLQDEQIERLLAAEQRETGIELSIMLDKAVDLIIEQANLGGE
ncbi:MAG TPA: trigger factor [Clostridia bacterium]|nr:trigger factor [Clostridia bacterium]